MEMLSSPTLLIWLSTAASLSLGPSSYEINSFATLDGSASPIYYWLTVYNVCLPESTGYFENGGLSCSDATTVCFGFYFFVSLTFFWPSSRLVSFFFSSVFTVELSCSFNLSPISSVFVSIEGFSCSPRSADFKTSSLELSSSCTKSIPFSTSFGFWMPNCAFSGFEAYLTSTCLFVWSTEGEVTF